MHRLLEGFLNRTRWKFLWRYLRGNTPWDTNITPPEVEDFMARTMPGRALDLGCGTGANAIALARRGWRVTGVDFVPAAIRAARAKAAGTDLAVSFHIADVTQMNMLDEPYDYVLDIGCFFSLKAEDRLKYRAELIRLTRPGGLYMLYAWLPRKWEGRVVGVSPEQVHSLLAQDFTKECVVVGEEKGHGSAWYWYRRGETGISSR